MLPSAHDDLFRLFGIGHNATAADIIIAAEQETIRIANARDTLLQLRDQSELGAGEKSSGLIHGKEQTSSGSKSSSNHSIERAMKSKHSSLPLASRSAPHRSWPYAGAGAVFARLYDVKPTENPSVARSWARFKHTLKSKASSFFRRKAQTMALNEEIQASVTDRSPRSSSSSGVQSGGTGSMPSTGPATYTRYPGLDRESDSLSRFPSIPMRDTPPTRTTKSTAGLTREAPPRALPKRGGAKYRRESLFGISSRQASEHEE
ncbi:hypothetical protein HDK90DRAFT_471043 [Phyllosticta capitalensis]|uniref:Uncharacterized protein n=1 Tax=Phyllosticta capitalensis TaxID=121624 RepID=A0ABR1Y8Q7_9PEZI